MRACILLGFLGFALWNVSAWEVELNEIVNPSLVRVRDSPSDGRDQTCAPDGCRGILTRDGSRSASSRYGCTQQEPSRRSSNACTVTQRLNEAKYSRGTKQTISSLFVAFTADSEETTLQVLVDDEVVVESWTGKKGVTKLQEIQGVSGYTTDEIELVAVMSVGSYIGITEVEIFVEVDEVPVAGISASERVSVTASATVNKNSAKKTLDGKISSKSSWSCSKGDVCEITLDMLDVQSMQQLRIAFGDGSSTAGAKFNVYTAGADGKFSSVLSGVKADLRDPSLEGLQTFGGVRRLARYVKIEGIPGSGGDFTIREVEIRVKEDAPSYPTTVDSSLVPLGRLPLGQNRGTSASVPYDPRPASEGGCSAGHLEGCSVYNVKDGINTSGSRWSCSPKIYQPFSDICHAQFRFNTQTYLRQIQLAFHKGDARHNEFSIHLRTEGGWVVALPSAISSGDTEDFQTWDISAWTSMIEFQPKFGSVNEWNSIKEMVFLVEEQSPDSTPILRFDNRESSYSSDILPISEVTTNFSFDLEDVGSEGRIYVGGGGRDGRVWAVKMKFPSNKSFTFDIQYYDENTEVSTRFTSAGGEETWEEFVLPKTVTLTSLTIVSVQGPDDTNYPTLRVSDCQVMGEPYSPGSTTVVSTTVEEWFVVPNYIGDGKGDQEEIMQAICDGIGEGFDGTDCDGVATGKEKTPEVNLVMGDYYLDGPVFLKSGVSLRGEWSEDDAPYETGFRMHGSGTGADGVINADGVSGASVGRISIRNNLESGGPAGTVGNVCLDVKNSEDIAIDVVAWRNCPVAGARFVDTDGVTAGEFYGSESGEGPEVILDGITDFILTESVVEGATVTDSVNVLFEGRYDDGDLNGSINIPKGGDQSANLVVSGSTSGVTLRDISIGSGAEPRIVLQNSNPFTIDGVAISGGSAGDCIIQFPKGFDGNDILTQLNVETELLLEDDCFVLA